MTDLDDALSRLDRGQRARLRELAGQWNRAAGDRAICDVFGELMGLIDAAGAREEYVILHAERELSAANESSALPNCLRNLEEE